jgi:restriction endonuclease S subunit
MMNLQKDKWEKYKIGDVCQVVSGGTPSRVVSEYFGGDIEWFVPTEIPKARIEEITSSREKITTLGLQKSSAKMLPRGTVLLTSRATIGLIAIIKKEATTNQGFASFICNEKQVKNWYLAYWLYSRVDEIKSLSVGTTFKEISRSIIRNLSILLPPLDEQERIVALFQSIEQAIIQAEGQEKNLKSLQKTLSNGLVSDPPIFGNLLSKKICKPCLFCDVVECVEEHDRTPLENGLTRFVGLENIEPENFSLQGFGNIENGTTFTKRFAKGDVLFGKRRAYLKKVAIANFDGICSSDILAFRAIKEKILPELLPFYVSSDAFINHAVATSAGSLSPRTKWKDLASFQLFIPDIKTQEKMVDVFNQLSQSLQLLGKQKETLKKLKQKLLNEILG